MKKNILIFLGLLGYITTGYAKHHLSLTGDFVYMRRTQIHDRSLVEDSNKFQCPNRCPNYAVLSTEDLVHAFEFEPGYRVGFMLFPAGRNSLEGSFLYLKPWHGSKTKHGDQSLSFPFQKSNYSQDFTDASEAHAEYESHFWDAELNYWRNFGALRDTHYFALSGIAGLRYFRLDERFRLTMIKPPDSSSYHIRTENQLSSAQLGLDFQMNPTRWLSWEAFAKVGLAANYTKQHQFLGDVDNTVALRNTGDMDWQMTFFTDVMAEIVFRFLKYFQLHGGYQMMYFSGLALAPEQVSKGVGKHAGKEDYTDGTAIIHGLFAGLTISF